MKSTLTAFLLFGTPFLAVLGGIIVTIIKVRGQQRLAELAQRERILAIEKGLDVSQLPPLLPQRYDMTAIAGYAPRTSALRKVQALMISGVVMLGIGISLGLMLLLLPDGEASAAWPVGIMPMFVGIALLIAARLVRRGADEFWPPAA